MQRIAKRLINGSQLGVSASTYYTAPNNTTTTISAMTLTNDTTSAVTATVHIVPSGSTATSLNKVLSARTISAGESYNVGGAIGQTLEAGGTIQALASVAASITIVASGYEAS